MGVVIPGRLVEPSPEPMNTDLDRDALVSRVIFLVRVHRFRVHRYTMPRNDGEN